MGDLQSNVIHIKEAYDIYDYISNYGVRLVPAGAHKYKGLCPFHSEKTPSFIVDTNFQNYRCFGCGESGDIIEFVQKTEAVSFVESLEKLAFNKNIELQLTNNNDKKTDYTTLYSLLEHAYKFFTESFQKLNDDHPAVQEITKRGFSRKGYDYGFADDNRTSLLDFLVQQGFTKKTIVEAGCAVFYEESNTYRDKWSGRLMFPIRDNTGRVVGFSGRSIYQSDTKGKYINSPATPIFDKSKLLFNFSNIKKKASEKKTIFICEGQFDVIAFKESGIDVAVASSGTALTSYQALMCRRIVGDTGKIIFCFDSDKAGVAATKKALINNPELQTQAYAVSFPQGMDPCDYQQKFSQEEFKNFIKKNRKPLIDVVLDNLRQEYDLSKTLEKEAYVSEALKIVKTIISPSLQETCLRHISFVSMKTMDTLYEELKKVSLVSNHGQEKEEKSIIQETHNNSSGKDFEDRLISTSMKNRFAHIFFRLCFLLMALENFQDNEKLFLDARKNISNNILPIYDEILQKKRKSEKFIPELYSFPKIISFISQQNYYPFLTEMNDDAIILQCNVLIKEMEKERTKRKKNSRYEWIMSQFSQPMDVKSFSKYFLELNKDEKELRF